MHKDRHFKNLQPDRKTVNFRHNGTHAANAVLPPPAYTPTPTDNTMAVEEHFAFKATCEHEDNKIYNVYPTCEGATFRKDKDEEDELNELIAHYDLEHSFEFSGSEDNKSYFSEPEDSDYDPEEAPSLYEDSSDDENDELDPATRTSLNPEAKTTNIDKEDPIMQTKLTENSDLTVTFSDEEEDADTIVLPTSDYLLYFRWDTRYGFHDHIPFESAIYEFGDMTIHIKVPSVLTTIYDTPAYYFLTQVKEETIRLDTEVNSSKYLHPSGMAEIHFNFSLLSVKVLHYASNYGCSTSPSWTLAKDVPEGIIKAMLAMAIVNPCSYTWLKCTSTTWPT
jgi:hypothetical protein